MLCDSERYRSPEGKYVTFSVKMSDMLKIINFQFSKRLERWCPELQFGIWLRSIEILYITEMLQFNNTSLAEFLEIVYREIMLYILQLLWKLLLQATLKLPHTSQQAEPPKFQLDMDPLEGEHNKNGKSHCDWKIPLSTFNSQ